MPEADDLHRLAARVEHSAAGVRDLAGRAVDVGELTWRGPAGQAFRAALVARQAELLRLAGRIETVAADVRTLAAVVAAMDAADATPGAGLGAGT